MSKLFVVGIGPGGLDHMTFEARAAIEQADVVVGYDTYLGFIAPLIAGKETISSGMTREVERCRKGIEEAQAGKTVALVSSGDAGIYGMAGLVLELLERDQAGTCGKASLADRPEVVVIPGVSALQAAASILGAPLMHDFAVISLSDLLTPWDLIERRLALAAAGDFVIALYNPRSKGRVRHLEEARRIILSVRPAATPVGIVRNACRTGEEKVVTTLGDMLSVPVDMFSLVLIGNSATFIDREGRMVTPRGYEARSTSTSQRSRLEPKNLEEQPAKVEESSGTAIMFCGTGSDVGKSVLSAGFCRILKNRGITVAPFKSQNMALNSAVTPEGGEIGRAQAVQADACGIPCHTDMNPVLLKPNSDTGSQVILQGKVVRNMSVKEYNLFKPEAFLKIRESYNRLRDRYGFIVIEGAGSIAEINLKAHDIANMKIAEMADAPVILVADIDRGGVFAQIVGTIELLEPNERERVKGIIINKFRGDVSLLQTGIEFVEKRTGISVLGVVPWFKGFRIPDEDSVPLQRRMEARRMNVDPGKINVGVVRFPHISNYTDFDSLEHEPDICLGYIQSPQEVAGLDLLILPGSKSTISDLRFLDETGLSSAIRGFTGTIVGICGGYQMLGRKIFDPHGVESEPCEAEGLGLLDAETVMLPEKQTHQVTARLMGGDVGNISLEGYEIHMGATSLGHALQPFATITSRSGGEVTLYDGAVSSDGRIIGTYIHGVFDNPGFRSSFLSPIRGGMATVSPGEAFDPFDLLAEHLEKNLDMERMMDICGLSRGRH